MDIKESIKGVLQMGGSISIPFKSKIDSWYSEVKISEISDKDDGGSVYVIQHPWLKFCDIDEAVNYFCNEAFTSKNYGYIQDRLRNKGLIGESSDLENPSNKIKKMFEDEGRLVDEEAKDINILIKPFPSEKDAELEFKELMDNFDPKTISDVITKYKRKYITIDPYISISLQYDAITNGNQHEHGYSMDISSFYKMYKKRNTIMNKDSKFKNIKVTFKLRDKEEYQNYIK